MKLYDSYSGQLKLLEDSNKVSIYVCGPTVYNHVHIGNLRPVVVFDLIHRIFRYKNKDILYVHNFTDVDDKIIKESKLSGVDEIALAKKYMEAYNRVLKNMNILKPTHQPTVTQNIDLIISYIIKLINKGYAYERDGTVYFRVHMIKEYGDLSNKNTEDLISGMRKEINLLAKENEHDFALWKRTTEGVTWNSPWGKGRPGWHTECAAFINHFFKGQIDIHGGGIDLKFPHHENENAQCLACNEHQLAKIWVHNGHLKVDGEKMSKSLGNFMLAKDAVKKHGANMVRMILLSSPHTQPIDFNDDVIKTVDKQYQKIVRTYKTLKLKKALLKQEYNNEYQFLEKFVYELENNLNLPNAMVVLNDLTKIINKSISNNDRAHIELSDSYFKIVEDIIGLKFEFPEITDSIVKMYEEWNILKSNKEYEKADAIRMQLSALGII